MKIGRRQALVGGALIAGGCGKTRLVPGNDAGIDGRADAALPPPLHFGDASCDLEAIYAADRRTHDAPAAQVFYSWTTPEQVAELRQGKVLFTRTERPGLGPGYAMDLFAELAKGTDEQARVAALLVGPTFAKARYAWTSAWPTRMGWPGESYGNQLLRIDLRPEAYTLAFIGQMFRAFDMSNKVVPLSQVLASPERIGAVYFVKDDILGSCAQADAGPVFNTGGAGGTFGTFSSSCVTGVGYREYILGNEAMVAEWSHATDATRAEIDRGRTFLDVLRARLPPSPEPDQIWNARVVDYWSTRRPHSCADTYYYIDSLALPSAYYEPGDGRLAAVVDTLAGDLFTPDPFVVKPGG